MVRKAMRFPGSRTKIAFHDIASCRNSRRTLAYLFMRTGLGVAENVTWASVRTVCADFMEEAFAFIVVLYGQSYHQDQNGKSHRSRANKVFKNNLQPLHSPTGKNCAFR